MKHHSTSDLAVEASTRKPLRDARAAGGKAALRCAIGLWLGCGDPVVAEVNDRTGGNGSHQAGRRRRRGSRHGGDRTPCVPPAVPSTKALTPDFLGETVRCMAAPPTGSPYVHQAGEARLRATARASGRGSRVPNLAAWPRRRPWRASPTVGHCPAAPSALAVRHLEAAFREATRSCE